MQEAQAAVIRAGKPRSGKKPWGKAQRVSVSYSTWRGGRSRQTCPSSRVRSLLVMQTVGCTRCPALESDLRKSKRAEAKLHALQFRTRNDLEKAGGDVR